MRTASRFVIVIIFLGVVLGGIFGYKFYQFGQMKELVTKNATKDDAKEDNNDHEVFDGARAPTLA